MMKQRPISLNPSLGGHLEAVKITWPPIEAAQTKIVIEAMRFIPHSGRAGQ
jgi:hypothetical protein